MFNKWEHIFLKGEYPARDRLLSGLTLEQVNIVPPGVSHSLYQELWHLVMWQEIGIENDKDGSKNAAWENGVTFPDSPASSIEDWDNLRETFLTGVKKILDFAERPENLEQKTDEGYSIADGLECLAVHNAVHFGKILAIRQMIGAWPPKE